MIPNSQKILTQARLKELLHYDPETGLFTYLIRRGSYRAGTVAGCRHNQGYWQIMVDRKLYLAHRLAVFYMTGAWPEADVDHMNGDRSDTRWVNLRCASRQTNMHNWGGIPAHNTSGLLGASWDKKKQCWRSFLTLNNKYVHLGYHPTAEAAHTAYLKAKDKLHPTHLRLREAA